MRLHAGFVRNDLYGDISEGDFVNDFHEVNRSVALVTLARWSPVSEVGLTFGYYFGHRLRGVSVGLAVDF